MVKITEANSGIFPVGVDVKVDDRKGTIVGYAGGVYRIITDDGEIYVEQDKVKII